MGTSVGTQLFNSHGWRASAGISLAWQSFALLVSLARGPHCPRYTWVGYKGGLEWRKRPQSGKQDPAERHIDQEKSIDTDKAGEGVAKGSPEVGVEKAVDGTDGRK